MPPDRFAYVHPDHDTHGGSVINDNDHDAIYDYPDVEAQHAPYFGYEPADVTVSDLLDTHYNLPDHVDDCPEWTLHDDVWSRADRATRNSAYRVLDALRLYRALPEAVAALTPEQRAEFDRRTT